MRILVRFSRSSGGLESNSIRRKLTRHHRSCIGVPISLSWHDPCRVLFLSRFCLALDWRFAPASSSGHPSPLRPCHPRLILVLNIGRAQSHLESGCHLRKLDRNFFPIRLVALCPRDPSCVQSISVPALAFNCDCELSFKLSFRASGDYDSRSTSAYLRATSPDPGVDANNRGLRRRNNNSTSQSQSLKFKSPHLLGPVCLYAFCSPFSKLPSKAPSQYYFSANPGNVASRRQ